MALSFALLTEIVLVLAAVLNAGFILPVFRKLQQSERTNMASFQLNPEEALNDFKLFFIITVSFTVSTTLVLFGDFTNITLLSFAGNTLSMVSSFMPLIVFYRWWRRFK